MKTSLEIAQEHRLIPISQLAQRIGLLTDEVEPYGRHKARSPFRFSNEWRSHQEPNSCA
jgi:formate--tetrahydrofolate ligase